MDEGQSDENCNELGIEVKEGRIFVDGDQLLDDEVQRSKLLKNMLNSQGLTSVPLSASLFKRWRQHVSKDMEKQPADAASNAVEENTSLSNCTLDDRVAVLEVREVANDRL